MMNSSSVAFLLLVFLHLLVTVQLFVVGSCSRHFNNRIMPQKSRLLWVLDDQLHCLCHLGYNTASVCVGITADVGPSRTLLSDRQCHFYGSVRSVPEAFIPVSLLLHLYHLFYATTEHHVYKSYSSC